tara:strand:- start:503 stop:688 length:186 start_codon:yes stop_codon:yes gene_type:complete
MSNTNEYIMKQRISITIDDDTMNKVRDKLRSKTYRNKSHFFELAAEELMKEEELPKEKKRD